MALAVLFYAFCPHCFGATADLMRSRLSNIWQESFPAPNVPAAWSALAPAPTFRRAMVHLRSDSPHPAVVRVMVPERGATSYGSGTLIDVREQFGLVITNWHVVRDASGPIQVTFPGGFTSTARALKVDADWDLAALVIWRPSTEPVPIASQAPQPGDLLTICGYGSGNYRAATGRCTQYYAPRMNLPQQMVELDVEARQGDSGGPIFNARGELAGVLFGAGQGTTMGSFGGRVDSFLATLAPDIGQVAGEALAQSERPSASVASITAASITASITSTSLASVEPVNRREDPINPPTTEVAAAWPLDLPPSQKNSATLQNASTHEALTWQDLQRNSWFEQLKTVLAAIGLLAIIVQVLRVAG